MRSFRVLLGGMSLLPRATLVGAAGAGITGAIVGLLVGLAAYPPTAAFAVLELGVPATIAGACVGLLIGLVILLVRRIGHRSAR